MQRETVYAEHGKATPNGGHYMTAFYQDDNGNPVDKSKATRAEVIEYDRFGQVVARTYAEIEQG